MGWIEDRLDEDFATWKEQLTDPQAESLLNYQGRNHAIINRFFRDPDATAGELSDEAFEVIEEVTRHIDGALDSGQLQRDVQCYRGLRDRRTLFGRRQLPEDLIGFGFEERAYCSASTDEFRARRFVAESGFLLMFRAPAGTPAAWMPALEHETYAAQRELLLERGIWFRVENVWQDSDTLIVEAMIV